jgi:hypothetical protein
MPVKFEVAAVVGEKQDGKPIWKQFGKVFETDRGLSLKLDSIPIAKDFDGWFKLFPPKDGGQTAPRPAPKPAEFEPDQDIPF